MRSIRELEALAVLDCRFHAGTFKNWSSSAVTTTPMGTTGFSRTIGQVNAMRVDAQTKGCVTDLAVPAASAFTIELMCRLAVPRQAWANTRLINTTGASVAVFYDDALKRFLVYSGTNLGTPNNSVYPGDLVHAVFTRNVGGTCVYHLRSCRGYVTGSGNIGTTGSTVLAIGNSSAGTLEAAGDYYVARYFPDEITSEEASLLYEHSRIQLQPGAPKRSGIMSVR